MNLDKKAVTFLENGHEVLADISKAQMLRLKFRNKVKHFEEDQVYPLSIKYDKRKTIRINMYKYFFLIVIIVLVIPFDLYSLSKTKTSKQRVGYFTDRIYTDSISISGATEINVSIKNWYLENTINSNSDFYMSASVVLQNNCSEY